MDIFKKGNFVETPYQNFYEIRAKDFDRNLIKMDKFYKNTLLVVNISPYDKNFDEELKKLIDLKNLFLNENFEILAFPSAQIDNVELSDKEMLNALMSNEIIRNNLEKIKLFNRVYVNGEETCEVLKFCYRNSPMFMFREGKSKIIDKNFTKFLISRSGNVYSYYTPDINNEEIEKNIKYLIAQKLDKIKIREDFINFNKFY